MKAGDWLDNRYRIIRTLGMGGEGKVYLAIQERIYKFYAVKVLEKEENFSEESVQLWKRLSHPGLPEIVDIVEQEGQICLVMEYIEGQTIEELLGQKRNFTWGKVIDWAIQICEILEYLHGQNPPIIFGDIKLANLILQKERIVMVDLGSAMMRNSKGRNSGTKSYLPINEQQWEALPARDIYALGKCLEFITREMKNPCGEWKKILRKCLTGDQKEAYQDVRMCRLDLEKLRNRPWILMVMVLLTFSVMMLAAETVEKEQRAVDAAVQYEQLLEKARHRSMKEQIYIWEEAITMDPACEKGYLELVANYLEDSNLSEEEDFKLRSILTQSNGDGISYEEKLWENQIGYGAVAWELGMAYWYFYEGEGGRNYAIYWFGKILEQQEKNALSEAQQQQCQIYGKIGEYRLKLEHGDRSGETEVSFEMYWEDLKALLEIFEEETKEIGQTVKLCFFQELLIQMEHYRLEFVQAGVEEEEMQQVRSQIKNELGKIPDTNKVVQQKKKEIQELLKYEEGFT